LVDLAHKVIGVSSVGTQCWVALMMGRDGDDPLFPQVKEAEASVLERHAGPSEFENHGERVVQGQWLMQAASDILLGWLRTAGPEGRERHFYVRQLWDGKASVEVEALPPEGLAIYGRACGWTLARAHARSGDRIAIAAYLGKGDAFDRAITQFAECYADPDSGEGVGVARFVRTGPRNNAEVAVTVVDDWQGRGLGTILLELLAERAREEGIETFSALLLTANTEMLDLLRRLGSTRVIEREGSCIEVEEELPPAGIHPGLRELLRRSADPASGVRPAKAFAHDDPIRA